MIYIEPDSKDAAFHFSVEEYIVRHYPWHEPVLLIWQADKCAMIGSNQIAEAEIDMSYAKQNEIQIVRRSSGGGTIYTDMGTLLYTMILPRTKKQAPLELAREKVATPIAKALNSLGVPAKIEGRNDILVDGKKVSGLAQYARYERICTHGSLLYDADLETIANLLRVDEDKIRSKALKSVRSRVTNIREYMSPQCSTEEFWMLLKRELFSQLKVTEHSLTEHDIDQISEICHRKYGADTWNFRQPAKFSFRNSKRFTGGKVEVYLDVDKGIVTSCSIRGDFLGVLPIRGLEKALENKLFQHSAFDEAITAVSVQSYLGLVTKDEFLSCMFN